MESRKKGNFTNNCSAYIRLADNFLSSTEEKESRTCNTCRNFIEYQCTKNMFDK